ncbi:hypothetical protein NKH77_28355 [Streptomyces sp. M19]
MPASGLVGGEPVPVELAGAALRAALHDSYDDALRHPGGAVSVAHPNGFVKLPLAHAAGGRGGCSSTSG